MSERQPDMTPSVERAGSSTFERFPGRARPTAVPSSARPAGSCARSASKSIPSRCAKHRSTSTPGVSNAAICSADAMALRQCNAHDVGTGCRPPRGADCDSAIAGFGDNRGRASRSAPSRSEAPVRDTSARRNLARARAVGGVLRACRSACSSLRDGERSGADASARPGETSCLPLPAIGPPDRARAVPQSRPPWPDEERTERDDELQPTTYRRSG